MTACGLWCVEELCQSIGRLVCLRNVLKSDRQNIGHHWTWAQSTVLDFTQLHILSATNTLALSYRIHLATGIKKTKCIDSCIKFKYREEVSCYVVLLTSRCWEVTAAGISHKFRSCSSSLFSSQFSDDSHFTPGSVDRTTWSDGGSRWALGWALCTPEVADRWGSSRLRRRPTRDNHDSMSVTKKTLHWCYLNAIKIRKRL